MKFNSTAEILANNQAAFSRFAELIKSVSDQEASVVPAGEQWSLKLIAEHVALVDGSIAQICKRLLDKGEKSGVVAADGIIIGDAFLGATRAAAGQKIEAPSIVRPTGDQGIVDSLASVAAVHEGLASMQTRFDQFSSSEVTFPHPHFGEMSAAEWLMLIGGHIARHAAQAERVIVLIRS